jgi:hypothetical protein
MYIVIPIIDVHRFYINLRLDSMREGLQDLTAYIVTKSILHLASYFFAGVPR